MLLLAIQAERRTQAQNHRPRNDRARHRPRRVSGPLARRRTHRHSHLRLARAVPQNQHRHGARAHSRSPSQAPTFSSMCAATASAPNKSRCPSTNGRKRLELRCRTMTTTIATPAQTTLSGSVLVLIQFDVCEEIRLDQLQQAVERAHRAAAQNQALGARLRALSAAAGGRAARSPHPQRRRAPRRRNQVLRLRRRQRHLPARVFRRLGKPRPSRQPLGVGRRFCGARRAHRAPASRAQRGRAHQALRALAQRRLLHLPRAQ